jgi:hypothetical protein
MNEHDERVREDERRVAEDHELLREDEARLRDDEERLREDKDREHHDVEIIVNGRARHVTGDRISFERVVELAFGDVGNAPNAYFTMTYRNGPHGQVEGSLVAGESVRIKDGMIFNVSRTDKS